AETVRLAGARLRRIDGALMAALGVARVAIRVPRILVLPADDGAPAQALAQLIAQAVAADGGDARVATLALEPALRADGADAFVALDDRDGRQASALARAGEVAFRGLAIRPGQGTALGYGAGRPVLILPDGLDGALSGWLTVGRRLLARLAFRLIE